MSFSDLASSPSDRRSLGPDPKALLFRWVWTPIHALEALYFALWTAFWISIALLVQVVTRSARIPLRMARSIWARGIITRAPFGYRLRVENHGGIDFRDPFLFASNHRSFLDVPVLFRALPTELRFVVKAELAKIPFFGAYIRAMGMVFVERKRTPRAARRIDRIREILAEASVVAFPEGTRSPDGRVLPFRTGALSQAIQAGAPIVPVAILGTEKGLPPGAFRPRPAEIRVVIGSPIPTTDLDVGDRRELATLVRSRVIELIESADDGRPVIARSPPSQPMNDPPKARCGREPAHL